MNDNEARWIVVRNSYKRAMIELLEVKKDSYANISKDHEKHFTRKRKMPLGRLVLSVLARKGRTAVIELRSLFRELNETDTISKAGYSKQRQKLNPRAFSHLSDLRAKNFYRDKSAVKKMKNYVIVASDGSNLNLPNTKETFEKYGSSARKGVKTQSALGLGCMFDVLNKMIIGATINRVKFDERKCALSQMNQAEELIGNSKVIYVFDRGYPSGELFINLAQMGRKYLMRLSSTTFKAEQKNMEHDDEIVTIVFDKTRINAHRQNGNHEAAEKLMRAGSIKVRFVKILLDTGETEYLATNLSVDEFSLSELKRLYHLRWEIETAFDTLKNKLQIENFSGTSPIVIEQDIFATIYLSNILHDMLQEAQQEFDKTNTSDYKYQMAINKNIAIGLLKEALIQFVLAKNRRKQKAIFKDMIMNMQKYIEPVRDDRKFQRTKGKLANSYSNVNKRAY